MVSSMPEDTSEFGFKKWFASGWFTVRDRWFILMMAAFLRDFISLIAAGLAFAFFVDLKGWNIAIAVLMRFIVWAALEGGYLKVCLNTSRQDSVSYRDLFSGLPFCFNILIATTCFWLSVALGLVVFIVPGLIILVRCSLYGLAIIDKKSDAVSSLFTSYRMLSSFTKYVTVLILINCLMGAIAGPLAFLTEILFPVLLCTLYDRIRAQEANP
jgi:hypothetical protein